VTGSRLLLIGAGGHARSCIDVIERQGHFAIQGLVGTAGEVGRDVLGYRVLGDDAALGRLLADCPAALVAVGQIESPEPRINLFGRVRELGFDLPTIVSPAACVSRHSDLGPGTIVMHGAVVNAGARIGENCIINSQSLIEHDARVGAHCHIATRSVVNGGCRIGEGSFLGSGSVLREGLTVGERCIIGMGLIVRRSLSAHSRVVKMD
jgi:sugar O-acyltransferase (sialic acid O-acetyltransferase NeuD family)